MAECRDNPSHNCAYLTAGKIIAIGRIYSASPERGAGTSLEADSKLEKAIGDAFAKSALDAMLKKIQFNQRFSRDIMECVVKIHEYLVTKIVKTTEQWSNNSSTLNWRPRKHASFVSKYLHFHRPNAFPIMDSNAKAGLKCSGHRGSLDTYRSFCSAVACYTSSLSSDWTPRSIDNDLVSRGRIHQEELLKCRCCKHQHVKRPRTKQKSP